MAEVDVHPHVVIRRPRADVAAFMFDPHNDLAWTGGIVESLPLSDGPLQPGSRVERVARFLGRTFAYEYEVLAVEPDCSVEMSVARPFPMRIRYELEDADDGTLVRIRARGDPGRFFGLASPLLRRLVRRSIAKDLRRLRVLLEST